MRRPLLIVAVVLVAALALPAPRSIPATQKGPPDPARMLMVPAVVLRMETVGGFAPLQALLMRVPTFTLYSDGSAVYRPAPDPGAEDPGAASLATTTLSPELMAELLGLALDGGGLREAREDYQVGGIADATTTVFTVRFGDVDKSVSVYALGLDVEGPDRRAYRRFLRLAELLADFDAWLPEDAEVGFFQPAVYRAIFVDDDPEQFDAVPWPWTDLVRADLVPVPDAPAVLEADLTPAQAALVSEVPTGGATGIIVLAPDASAAWRLSVRPLLPDEPMILIPGPEAADDGTGDPSPTDDQEAYELSG
jgi:hypothetical protein